MHLNLSTRVFTFRSHWNTAAVALIKPMTSSLAAQCHGHCSTAVGTLPNSSLGDLDMLTLPCKCALCLLAFCMLRKYQAPSLVALYCIGYIPNRLGAMKDASVEGSGLIWSTWGSSMHTISIIHRRLAYLPRKPFQDRPKLSEKIRDIMITRILHHGGWWQSNFVSLLLYVILIWMSR